MTSIARESLVLRREGISPSLSLLMPTSAFPDAPAKVTLHLQRNRNAPLPILYIPRLRRPSYTRLLSTPRPSTSELLRTLRMNGCFQANILAVTGARLR